MKNRYLTVLVGLILLISVWLFAFYLLLSDPLSPAPLPLPTLIDLNLLTNTDRSESRTTLPSISYNPEPLRPLPTQKPAQPSHSLEIPTDPVPDSVILQFDPSMSDKARQQYIQQMGGTIRETIESLNTVIVELPPQTPPLPVPQNPQIIIAEPDYYVTALDVPMVNDPHYVEQWALPVIGASDAWAALPANTPDVVVAVIDSGVCLGHADLQGRLLPGWDYVDNDSTPDDLFGHGCAVAGIISAVPDNAIGIAGVAPNSRIMPIRVLDHQGLGRYSDVAAAIVYAVNSGAQIINLSLGGYNTSSVMESAVNYAAAHGVTVVAAAGNTGTQTILYPAAYPSVISVGAVGQALQPSSFSSYGPGVKLWAPGQDILTTSLSSGYALMNGTSFAAPHVSGIAALELAHGRRLPTNGGLISLKPTPTIRSGIPTATLAMPPATPNADNLPALFGTTDTQAPLDTSDQLGVLRSRLVTINFSALPSDASPQAQADSSALIELNLFDDVVLTASREQVIDRLTGEDGFIWTASIVGEEYGEVVLVAGDGQLGGHVSVLGKTYQIAYAGDETHIIREIDPGAYTLRLNEDGIPREMPEGQAQPAAQRVFSSADNGDVIDILVVYTPSARDAAGGTTAIRNAIEAAVVATNKSYVNSGINQRIRLKHSAVVNYNEVYSGNNLVTDLNRVSSNQVSGVFGLRNTHAADLVVFIVNVDVFSPGAGSCGIGWLPQLALMQPGDPWDAGFNVVALDCLPGGLTFAHELGHNMGAAHDFDHANGPGAFSYSYGFQEPSSAFHTIMAYPDGCLSVSNGRPCPAINYWSNQIKTLGGKALGNAAADNRTALNNTASLIAKYRDSGGGGPAPTPTHISPATQVPLATSTPPDAPGDGCDFNPANTAQLIADINSANSTPLTDEVICLNGGTYTLTAPFDTDQIYGYGPYGLPQITTTITIRGNGSTITRTGSEKFRHFYVIYPGNLTLDNVTLSNGDTYGSSNPEKLFFGGSILNLAGTLTLTNSTLTQNRAFQGGAIASVFVNGGNSTVIRHTTLSNNTSFFGGAVYNESSTLSILNSRITGNLAYNGSAVYDASAAPNTSSVSISWSVLTENSVNGDIEGSAIYSEASSGSTTAIDNSCIYENANFAVSVAATAPNVTAINNWWGHPNGPTVGTTLAGDMIDDPTKVTYSPFRSVRADPCAMPAPSNVQAVLAGIRAINVSWDDNSTETAFSVERSSNGVTGWVEIATVAANQTSYLDSNLACNSLYYYRIRAYDLVSRDSSSYSSTSAAACTPNDDFADAYIISALPYLTYQVNQDATTEAGEPAPSCSTNVGATLWYSYTPSTNETILLKTDHSDVDTVLALWTGPDLNNLTEVACDDNSGPNSTASTQVTLTQGVIYYIMIGTGNAEFGEIALYAVQDSGITPDLWVTTLDDTGAGSLREAITTANGTAGITEIIGFQLPKSANYAIRPITPLPPITDPVIIDGSTQFGYVDSPIVELDGSLAGSGVTGLRLNAGNSAVNALRISNFGANGITISSAGSNTLTANHILANDTGILIETAANVIGGTAPNAGNVISGNSHTGIHLGQETSDGNIIQGNYIGINIDGSAAQPNQRGIEIRDGAQNNQIGGTVAAARNIISGNTDEGILILNADSNIVQGNYIGMDASGSYAVANGHEGILVNGSSNNVIGGTVGTTPGSHCSGACNLISGNIRTGIAVTTSSGPSSGNQVLGNFIGTNAAGNAAVPNIQHGISLAGTTNIIGDSSANGRNLISGNTLHGIIISGTTTSGNIIQGNYIGTDTTGSSAVGNGARGIYIQANANTNLIGPANVISGNSGDGITIDGPNTNNNTIRGNFIGTNQAANGPLPNGGSGILILSANNSVIGGQAPGEGNKIAYNTLSGIVITSGTGNAISGNSLYSNGALGIDLGSNGITLNDAGDGDSGANNLQNAPLFIGAALDGASTTVYGSLDSAAGTYRIEFFSSESCDSSGYGEGQVYLGSFDSAPGVVFSAVLPVAVSPTHFITMTATDTQGNTSEFSRCPLSPPSNLNTTTVSRVRIDLTWDDTTPNETGFLLERSTDGNLWVQHITLAANQVSHSDNGLDCGTIYHYRLKAHQSGTADYSSYTNTATAATVACMPNDNFAGALVINSLPFTQSENLLGSTVQTADSEPAPACVSASNGSIWYSFTPAANMTLWLDTFNSNFETALSVWTGSTLDTLAQVACDAGSGFKNTSFLAVPVTGGTTYYIMLAGKSAATGDFSVRIQEAAAPTPTPIPTITPLPTSAPSAATSRIGLYKDGVWWMSNTHTGGDPDMRFLFAAQESGWQPLVGNWDGDINQVDTVGLYRSGQFWLRNTNGAGFADNRFFFGPQEAGWLPIVGDWDGDGIDTVGLYRNGEWWLKNTNTDGFADNRFLFGPQEAGWLPIAGDWDGDGIDTVGLYRNGEWWLKNTNTDGAADVRFAASPVGGGWLPVIGDWNKDGIDTIGLYKEGVWWLRNSNSQGYADLTINFGTAENGWLPVAGRWDGALPLGAIVEITGPQPPTLIPSATPTWTPQPEATATWASESPTPVATTTLTPTETPTLTLSPTASPTIVEVSTVEASPPPSPTETPIPMEAQP